MKRELSGGITSRKRFAGKSDFSAKQVSTTLLLLLLCLLMPQKGWADIITTTYDFSTKSWDKVVTISSTTESNCTYFTKIGTVSEPGRFAAQGADKWVFERTNGQGVTYELPGLCNNNGGARDFLVSKLYAGDVVTFEATTTLTLSSTGIATANGNTFTMTSKGSLIVNLTALNSITKITIQHDNSGVYEYDPAVEIYDLSGINSGAVSATNSAGYKFSSAYSSEALILGNPSGYSLNNRIVVQNGDFKWANGLQNNGSGYRLVGINNLLEGDRVVITFTGTNTVFSSRHESEKLNQVFAAAGNVFKDENNDGELNDGETLITTPGTRVESQAVYTMTADGHLDIALERSQKITKIEIYGDHEAQMLDRFDASTGYTAYFSQTGQLMDKEHNLGGLEIHVGNENDTQHAIVVSSDKGPVSYVYDQEGYKMARQQYGGTTITEAPATGTFYKIIPETDGLLTLKFKAYSVRYSEYWGNGKTPGNEIQTGAQCPYYLMVKDGNSYSEETSTTKGNGADVTITREVSAGKTYYLYGWWNGTDFANTNTSCGVAQLLEVTFMPKNLVYPLAKYVASGTTSDDHLANVSTTTTNSDLHIKKKSANIQSCEPYVVNGVLKIRNIKFVSGQNPGGTILIKVGNPNDDAAPVFAYTIAYDASFNMPEGAARSEGHTWDFSTNPLRGLKWNNTSGEAEDVDFGKGAGPGLLYDEMHETLGGMAHSDWTFKYVTEKGDTKRDPMYLNKYPMEGDNADMMWDTEGLIFNTAANQSCINNEFGSVVNHASGGTATDPDRFVGIRNGGSFTIPKLEAGDRVVIFMGSANAYTSFFNITGALDAIGKTIEPTDEYNAGGSLWSTMGGACQYRGAYQFISTGGDMTFTLTKGELVKLYSIQIYAGVKLATTDASRPNDNTTYNGDEYVPGYQVFNDWRTETPGRIYLTIHYRGKGERLKVPTVLYKSGTVNTDESHLMYGEVGTDKAPFIFFKSEKDQYGVFRMRIEDYESGGKYVADYALQNITVGYLDKKNYPYTWDFTDLKGYANTSEFMNNSVGKNVKTIEQWKSYEADGDVPAGLGLQVRNEPYSGGIMWDYGQLYAGNEPFGETFGLSMEVPGVNDRYNGGLRITEEGLCLTGGNWKIRIPQVGTVASVYVRAKQVGSREITAGVGDAETAFTYEGTATDGTGDKIFAVKGTGEDMKLVFNNLIIKKIAVSQDTKTVNKLGYATESRNVEIDPELMGYMTGTGLKAYTVTNVTYGDKPGDKASVTLTQIPAENVMGKATSGDHRAYIIYNTADVKPVSILDGGFNLFVPDMHDESTASSPKKSILDVSGNPLVSSINGGSIPQSDGDYTNYLMNYKYTGADGKSHEGPEAFYRASKSATLGSNKAYLQLLTAKMKPTDTTAGAKIAIVFVDEEANTETTSLDGVKSVETLGDNAIYTLSGVKVSKPEKGGIYVKNGKKFIAK